MKNLICVLNALIICCIFVSCSADIASDEITEYDMKENTSANETSLESQALNNDNMYNITLDINGTSYSAKFYKNKATEELIKKMPLTFDMSDLNKNEKYSYLDFSLPTDAKAVNKISTGDIMLYGDDCLVVFYKDFNTAYSYTRLGYIESPDSFLKDTGTENISVTFRLIK